MGDSYKSALVHACFLWESALENKEQPLSQSELAEAWSLSRGTISQWYRGERKLNMWRIVWIKKRYGKSWAEVGKLLELDYERSVLHGEDEI